MCDFSKNASTFLILFSCWIPIFKFHFLFPVFSLTIFLIYFLSIYFPLHNYFFRCIFVWIVVLWTVVCGYLQWNERRMSPSNLDGLEGGRQQAQHIGVGLFHVHRHVMRSWSLLAANNDESIEQNHPHLRRNQKDIVERHAFFRVKAEVAQPKKRHNHWTEKLDLTYLTQNASTDDSALFWTFSSIDLPARVVTK